MVGGQASSVSAISRILRGRLRHVLHRLNAFAGLVGAAAVTIDIALWRPALPALRAAKQPWL